MKLYISGPIKGDPDAERKFAEAATLAAQAGYAVLNPFDVPAICTPPCRGATDVDRHWDCYMRGDLAVMVACDGVALLPGWERSRGARLEQAVAVQVGMPVREFDRWVSA